MELIKWTDTSESEILPFVSGGDQIVRDFLDEAYPVIIGEKNYGGPTSTSIIAADTFTSIDVLCHNIRIYLAQLNILAISYPQAWPTTRDAIEIVRWFCHDILNYSNIFSHCGDNKMLAALSAQRWMMYLDSIKNISRQSERVDSYNQGLENWEEKILTFVSIERLQKEIRISENWSAVFEGDYCFIQDWFQGKFWIDFWQAKSITFSSDTIHYPDEIVHLDGLPRTLNDFFQQIIEEVKNFIRVFSIWSNWVRLNLKELETKIESLSGQFFVSAYWSVYDLPETGLILKIQLWFHDLLEANNYFPRSPSF